MSLFTINIVVLEGGRLVRDAELRYTNNSTPQLSFTIAMNESYKDQSGQWQDKPEYHKIVFYGKLAESITPSMKKGIKVSITGRLSSYSYEDKETGKKHSASNVIADKVILLDRPKQESDTPSQRSYSQNNQTPKQPDQNTRNDSREEYVQSDFDYSPLTDEDMPAF